jgi:hypothetical protein
MKYVIVIFFFIFNLNVYGSDSLITTSKAEFDKGKKEISFFKDLVSKKQNGQLKIASCKSFVDNKADNDFYEYTCVGSLDKQQHLIIVKKTLYNGEEYLIVNTSKNCAVTKLLGKPHVFDSLAVNFNESETTDKRKIIEIWHTTQNGLVKKELIKYNRSIDFVDIRILGDKKFVLKDHTGKYWKIDVS